MSERTIHISTRGSQLALWQAHHVRDEIRRVRPAWQVELVIIKTQGDKILDVPLSKIGGKALFVKEIEQALLDGRADVAVHSMKDVPAELAPGLFMAATSRREDPYDALCTRDGRGLDELAEGATLGTSSLRRQCQILARRPDLRIEMLRGNVPTRLGKLDDGSFDAVILAAAGLKRLGHGERISQRLDGGVCVPAVGQGVLGIETRQGDAPADRELVEALREALHDPAEERRVVAERAMMAALGGSCQTPLAAHASYRGDSDPVAGTLVIEGLCGRPDGSEILRAQVEGRAEDAQALGSSLAEELRGQGAQAIIDACTSA
ncbi:hydroxymethylbilane synthase [Haliangium ochraceum]|uniref:Porphobilinogen deaminase n=1 Tax=Haliangium ochraceum (strain DSM 14365 / JCM 11303 / SMP-2) TaxID=502025 RepID=D0LUE1_HALO1|nr:hydroxymethylbilane synthase [Haliangium ochraceum]ACY19264.1 porphobilinogen deaminase [Haliangium ochraceum DSM 14365]